MSHHQEFTLKGMHCESCVTRIQSALMETRGILEATVTLEPPKAIVVMNRDVSISELREAVQRAGAYDIESYDGAPSGGDNASAASEQESLYPLLLIIGFIAGVTVLVGVRTNSFALETLMRHFMAGFFIVFGFFKLLDLRGFAETFRTYDLFAQKVKGWAWSYPFVEVALGAAYLLALKPIATNVFTLLLMGVGAIGVAKALLNKRRIRCACLGTVLNLPMTTVTLVEDVGMAAMAGAMLLFHI